VVLGEKILAIEVVIDALVARYARVVLGIAGPDIASVEAELQVLNRDMALPFVLRTKGDVASIVAEGADELALGGFRSLGA
jgi:hypothetical protein